VQRVYVESPSVRARAVLGLVLDRKLQRSGVRVKRRAASKSKRKRRRKKRRRPDSIRQIQSRPAVGIKQFQAREIDFGLGMNHQTGEQRRGRAISDAIRALTRTWMRRWSRSTVVVPRDTTAAGRQDVVRRQRAVRVPCGRREARTQRRGSPRGPGPAQAGTQLSRAERATSAE